MDRVIKIDLLFFPIGEDKWDVEFREEDDFPVGEPIFESDIPVGSRIYYPDTREDAEWRCILEDGVIRRILGPEEEAELRLKEKIKASILEVGKEDEEWKPSFWDPYQGFLVKLYSYPITITAWEREGSYSIVIDREDGHEQSHFRVVQATSYPQCSLEAALFLEVIGMGYLFERYPRHILSELFSVRGK